MTLVEYGDYECPYCGRGVSDRESNPQRLGDRLRFVFRNFPLAEMHPHAEHAAEAAEAAGAQGKFWEMHDMLFENQDALDDENLARYAKALGLDVPRFIREMESQHYARRAGARGFSQRGAERSERHADVFHQRRASRRTVRLAQFARRDRRSCVRGDDRYAYTIGARFS